MPLASHERSRSMGPLQGFRRGPVVPTTSPQGAFRNSLRKLKLFSFTPASPSSRKMSAMVGALFLCGKDGKTGSCGYNNPSVLPLASHLLARWKPREMSRHQRPRPDEGGAGKICLAATRRQGKTGSCLYNPPASLCSAPSLTQGGLQ